MKDYIYLDMNLANSYLAQIDEGILKKIVSGEGQSDSNQENGGETIGKEAGGSVGVPSIFAGSGKFTKTEVDTFATVSTKNSSELIETAMDDYSIDLLIKKLNKSGLEKSLENSNEGNFVLINVPFRFYDFEFMHNSLNKNFFKAIGLENDQSKQVKEIEEKLKEYDKQIRLMNKPNKKKSLPTEALQSFEELKFERNKVAKQLEEKKESIDIVEMLRVLSEFGDSLFPNSIILSSEGYLAYCNRANMRISQAQLSAISDSKRMVYILANISNVKGKVKTGGQFKNFQAMDLNIIPSLFTELLLGSFGLLESGDRILRPIAIYFDQN